MNDRILGVITYLDSNEVENLLASIEGGLFEQFGDKFRDSKSRKGESGANIPTGSMRERAREAIKSASPVSKFSALRKILTDNNYVRYIDSFNPTERTKFREGELVEIYGNVKLFSFGKLVDSVAEFTNLTTKFGSLVGKTVKIDPQLEQAVRWLECITNKAVPIRISSAKSQSTMQDSKIISVLIPEFLKIKKDSISGTFSILGRVKRLPQGSDEILLYDLLPGKSMISREQFKKAINDFTSKSMPGLNVSISEQDLRVKSPNIVISPIAMCS